MNTILFFSKETVQGNPLDSSCETCLIYELQTGTVGMYVKMTYEAFHY